MTNNFVENLFIALRPRHWIKNLFVFAALIFAVKFTETGALQKSLAAFALFCLASSGVYLLNDIIDYKKDRVHPLKKNRPIAADHLPRPLAVFISVTLVLISVILAAVSISYLLSFILAAYVILNLFYSLHLKELVILDVISIALGFVLRVIAGAVAINVIFSPWLLLCTFFLTLFLAIGKRKNELICSGNSEGRGVLASYSVDLLNQMNAVVLPSTLIAYTLYTFNSWHSQWLILTVPVVLYGLFRYLYIINKKRVSDDGPTDDLLLDRPLQLTVLVWVILVIVILTKFN